MASRSAASRALLPAGGSGNFSPRTGAGYDAYKKPDYARLIYYSPLKVIALYTEGVNHSGV